jgi:hypothetical protein
VSAVSINSVHCRGSAECGCICCRCGGGCGWSGCEGCCGSGEGK